MSGKFFLTIIQGCWQKILNFIFHRMRSFNETMKPLLDALGIDDPWTYLYYRRGRYYNKRISLLTKGFVLSLELLYIIIPIAIVCILSTYAIKFVKRRFGMDYRYNYRLYYSRKLSGGNPPIERSVPFLFWSEPSQGFQGDNIKKMASVSASFIGGVFGISYTFIILYTICSDLLDRLHLGYSKYPQSLDILKGFLLAVVIIVGLLLLFYVGTYLIVFLCRCFFRLKKWVNARVLDFANISLIRSSRIRVAKRS